METDKAPRLAECMCACVLRAEVGKKMYMMVIIKIFKLRKWSLCLVITNGVFHIELLPDTFYI